MAGYLSQLGDLIQLNKGGAIDPMAAIDQMYALQEQKKAQRQARQAAMAEQSQGLYGDLTEMAMSAAQEGTSFEALEPQLEAAQQFAGGGLPPGMAQQFMGGLDSLYNSSEGDKIGMSQSNPMLDDSMIADIMDTARSGTDRATVLSTIKNGLAGIYEPNMVERLMPQVSEIVTKIRPN